MAAWTFTELFDRGRRGDSAALNLAYRLVFFQLRRTARYVLDRESPGVTLQPTALVSELFLRFCRLECQVLNRDHFLRLAARSMRQLVIDRGRCKAARRRLDPEVLANVPLVVRPESAAQTAVRHVWERLRKLDPRVAEAIWLLKVEGFTLNEVAVRQRRPSWQVVHDAEFALDWMEKQLR